MKSAIIILSLMGCDDAARNCEYIDVQNRHFASEADCLRASEQVFEAHAGADYPMVMARCDLKTPATLADRSLIDDADANELAHEIVTVDLSEEEDEGWFRVGLRDAVTKVAKPVSDAASSVASKSQDTAGWLIDRAWAVVDYVNPF